MNTLKLEDQEVELLKELVATYLADLRVEIHCTDNLSYKEMLKQRKELVVKLLHMLSTEQKELLPE